jgi:glycosyltransferase involved in cell wall biosynthesis
MEQARRVFDFHWPARVVAPYGVTYPKPPSPGVGTTVRELEDQKFVLFLGRIHPCKNIPFLIRAWAKANMGEDWKLVIAGPSSKNHRRAVEKAAEKLCLRERCMFLDFVVGARKGWLLRNARWFVLPSEHENFGIAMFEALAHGCPVIISDQVYSAEYLEAHGRVLPLETERWTEFFRTRLRDEPYRRQVIASDAETVSKFKMDVIAEKWAGFLRSMFGKAQGYESTS